jgi:hypothetical protein
MIKRILVPAFGLIALVFATMLSARTDAFASGCGGGRVAGDCNNKYCDAPPGGEPGMCWAASGGPSSHCWDVCGGCEWDRCEPE